MPVSSSAAAATAHGFLAFTSRLVMISPGSRFV